MDPKITLPAAPRHLRRGSWLRAVDSTAFSPDRAAQVSMPLTQDEFGALSERRTALELESESVVATPAPALPQRPVDTGQRTRLRVALVLVVLVCVAIPVLLVAVIVLS